jgi:branched-chain amino acid transport system ATP-binding protein
MDAEKRAMDETFRPATRLERWVEPVIQAENLSLAFGGQRLLDEVSFVLPPVGAVLLRGDNGSGKTTLLNVLSGFIRPERGSIYMHLNDRNVDAVHTSPERLARSGLGRLWQDIRLFPTMTVMENVLTATTGMAGGNPVLALAAWPLVRRQERAARERALANLELVGMAERATSSGDRLSVGQMKRVAIARLLQAGAELLLLDEPLAGLDKKSAEGLISLLNQLNERQGKTLLVVEHQHERMAPVCNETWYLADGKLVTVEMAE